MTSSTRTGTPSGTRMRTIVQDSYGNSDVLRLDDLPRPDIKDDQVLVRVHAAGLDRGTWHLMTGTPYAVRLAMGLRRPKQPAPGRDVAGIVEEVGAAVTRFAPGDEVFGMGDGTFAEYAAVRGGQTGPEAGAPRLRRGRRSHLRRSPPSSTTRVGHVQRARRARDWTPPARGPYAVQLAKALGAEVTGVASTAKPTSSAPSAPTTWSTTPRTTPSTAPTLRPHPRRRREPSGCPGSAARSPPPGPRVIVGGEGSGQFTGMGASWARSYCRPSPATAAHGPSGADLRLEGPEALLESGPGAAQSWTAPSPLAQVPDAMRRLETGQARGKIAISVVQG